MIRNWQLRVAGGSTDQSLGRSNIMDLFVRPEVRSDSRAQLFIVAAVGLIVIIAVGRSAPTIPENIDPVVYLDVIHELRTGQEFHQTIDSVFRSYEMGPVDSVLAVRSPVGFWWLAGLGSDAIAWLTFLVAATIAALTIGSSLHRPAYAIGVIWYFAMVGTAAWTAPELWASVLVVIAVGLALRDRWIEATIVATVATSIRELALLVLVGLVLSRIRNRSGWSIPVLGIGVCAGLYLWHWNRTLPFLAADGAGKQARLFGTGDIPGSVLDMMSTWLPAGIVLGPVLFVATIAWAHRHGSLLVVAPVLALVMTGLIVHRPEWAIFVVPLTVSLGADELDHQFRLRRLQFSGGVPGY